MDRVPKKIKSGLNNNKNHDELILRSFINAFIAVIWRRNWLTVIIYSLHNKHIISSDLIRKCLQFNVFDETGIGNSLKPYFKYSAFTGLLDLDSLDLEGNDILKSDLERVISIFPESYKIETTDTDTDQSMNFIMDYGKTIFKENIVDLMMELRKLENSYNDHDSENNDYDSENNDHNSENNDHDSENNDNSHCKLCKIINKYEVDIIANHCEDRYMNIIIEGLMTCLK